MSAMYRGNARAGAGFCQGMIFRYMFDEIPAKKLSTSH
jgi:hypothetical protein